MSEQKRKLEQDFKRLSNLCLELDAEKNDLKAKYEKALSALKLIGIESEENNNFSRAEEECQFYIDTASACLSELGEK